MSTVGVGRQHDYTWVTLRHTHCTMHTGRNTLRAWPTVTALQEDWQLQTGVGGGSGSDAGGGGGGWLVARSVAKIRCFPLFLQLVDHLWKRLALSVDEVTAHRGKRERKVGAWRDDGDGVRAI